MRDWIYEQAEKVNSQYAELMTIAVAAVVIVLVAALAYFVAKKVLNYYSHKIAAKTATKIDDILLEKGVFNILARIAPALSIYFMLPMIGENATIMEEIIISVIIILIVMAIFMILDTFVDGVKGRSKAKAGPLKGIVQVAKIAITVLAILMVISTFLGNDKGWAIFSSIGGLSAVLLLIFRDSILGLVAGLQLATGGLLKLGDWLEMPKYNADGEVVDISLTKVTVKNWDKTYTAIPAYKFLEESFKNWEGMTETGGRRIKRAISIDVNTIGFLTEEQLRELKEIDVLKEYFSEKMAAIDTFNEGVQGNHIANIRQLTNIGTYRAYIRNYLQNHPKVFQELTLLVRQLAPTETGVPIEVYCFINDIAWANYEGIQADIFDHLFAVMPSFGLKPYQQVSGHDLSSLKLEKLL